MDKKTKKRNEEWMPVRREDRLGLCLKGVV